MVDSSQGKQKQDHSHSSSVRPRVVVTIVALAGAALLGFLVQRPGPPEPQSQKEVVATQTVPALPIFVPAPSAPTEDAVKAAPRPPTDLTACSQCEDENRGKDGCKEDMGCSNLGGDDKRLCEALLTCMRENPDCWATNPNKCYCGTTTGTACAKTPNGPCATEAIAAAKTDSPLTAGLRFFKTEFPSGHATQQIVCNLTACKTKCRQPR